MRRAGSLEAGMAGACGQPARAGIGREFAERFAQQVARQEKRFAWFLRLMPLVRRPAILFAMFAALSPAVALAQVKIGLVLSLTGPAASLGIPARDTASLLPKQIGGQSVEYIVLDDASDTTQAVQDTKKLISENHVDAIIGSSITPNSLAMIDVVADGTTP